jgi:hypothetical protein
MDEAKIDFSGIQMPEQIASTEEGTLTPEQLSVVQKEVDLEKKYGAQPLKSAAAGAARSLSFGISDQILTKTGLVDSQTLRELELRNKEASIAGEVAGIVVPAIFSGGTSLAGTGARAAGAGVKAAATAGRVVEEISAKTLGKMLAETGSKSLASKIIEKSLPKIAGSAVEGGFYGAGQLISEDALGTKEFNAENLISSIGTGAILGGVAGGVFKGFEDLTPVLRSGARNITEKGKSFLNPQEASLELLGIPAAKRLKLKKTNPDLVDELPDFLKNKVELGVLTSDRKLMENIGTLKEEAGAKIGDVLNRMEDITKVSSEVLPTKKELYTKIITDLDEKFINKFKNSPEYSAKVAPIKRVRNEYNKLAESAEGTFSPKEIDAIRRQLDDVIRYDKVPGTQTLAENATRSTRKLLRNEIDAIADRVSIGGNAEIANELKTANKDFSIASNILPYVEGKVEKGKLLNFSELIGGAGLVGIGGELGVLAGAAYKLKNSDIVRRLKILTQIESKNNAVENNITSSVKNFFSPVKEAAVPSSVNILLNTAYGRKDLSGKKPETKLEAFKNVQDNFKELGSNPNKLVENMRSQLALLTKHAPGTSAEVIATMQRATQFLGSKLPRDPKDPSIFPMSRWTPSSTELAKFERYLEATEHPKNVLNDLRKGVVSKEAVEALQAVYPNLYGRLQKEVMNMVAEDSTKLGYSKRLQLGLLLNLPTDNSLVSKSILKLQSSFIPKENAPMPQSKEIKNIGSSVATPIEKTLTRK